MTFHLRTSDTVIASFQAVMVDVVVVKDNIDLVLEELPTCSQNSWIGVNDVFVILNNYYRLEFWCCIFWFIVKISTPILRGKLIVK